MNAATLTPARLDARRRVAAIRDALAVADDLLAAAFAARDWEALGHADWLAYCAAELPELRHMKMRAPPRRQRGRALLAAGASMREMSPRPAPASAPSTPTWPSCSGGLLPAPAAPRARTASSRSADGRRPGGSDRPPAGAQGTLPPRRRLRRLSRLAAAGRAHRLTAPRGVVSPYVLTES
jgi:hypothetical protein